MQQPTFICLADAVFTAELLMACERIGRQDGDDEEDVMRYAKPPLVATPRPGIRLGCIVNGPAKEICYRFCHGSAGGGLCRGTGFSTAGAAVREGLYR